MCIQVVYPMMVYSILHGRALTNNPTRSMTYRIYRDSSFSGDKTKHRLNITQDCYYPKTKLRCLKHQFYSLKINDSTWIYGKSVVLSTVLIKRNELLRMTPT